MFLPDSAVLNAAVDWLAHGMWDLAWWQIVLYTLVTTHITIAAVTYRLITALAGWPLERIYYAADTRAEQLLIGCLLAALLSDRRIRVPAWMGIVGATILMIFVIHLFLV